MIFSNYDINFIAERFPANLNYNGILVVRGTQIMRSASLLGRSGFFAMLAQGMSPLNAVGAIIYNSMRVQLLLSRQGAQLVASDYYLSPTNKTEQIPHSTFIGEVFADVIVQNYLNTQKLIHIEQIDQNAIPLVFGNGLKPDFIGQIGVGGWVVVEAKGTCSPRSVISGDDERQAANLIQINGVQPAYNCVSKTYFRNGLSVKLRNIPIQQVPNVGGNVDIANGINMLLGALQNTPELFHEEVNVINGEEIRFISNNYLPTIMGMRISIGFALRLLQGDNFIFEPFVQEYDDGQVEVFSDGVVVRIEGEIMEVE